MQVRVSREIGQLLDAASAVSVRRGKYYVGVEHVFEALVQESSRLPKGIESKYLGILRKVSDIVAMQEWQGASPDVSGEVYYTPRCADLVNESSRLAERLHSERTSSGHLLLAILADAHASPSRAMDRNGLPRKELLEELRASLMKGRGERSKQRAEAPKASSSPAPAPSNDFRDSAEAVEGPAEDEAAPEPDVLDTLTRDLTALAAKGKLEPAVGREKELMEMIEILARKGKHNVVLVGEAGVGKTKVVEGLAVKSAEKGLSALLGDKRIVELNISTLMSGTQYRGAFEEKVSKLLRELQEQDDVILFIDEIHLIMGAGSTDGDGLDFANLLKPALGRGELRCIGATTLQEYRKFIVKDPAMERRFQMVRVEPLSAEATLAVLKALQPSLEQHHGVHISSKALDSAIALTERYLPNRQFPDKAIDVLDQACARYRIRKAMRDAAAGTGRNGGGKNTAVTPHDIRKVVSQAAAVPIEDITAEERMRLTDLDRILKRRIIGQDEAVAKCVSALKKSRAGLSDPNRPDAVMLFLGPTGVGKTQLAKELARTVFGSSHHLITFDMSEYLESHSVSKLIGAPPGYVGSDQEGLLTAAVQNTPFSIVLFDEIEKAHPKVFDVFLPILDEGRLKDSHGRVVSFRNCIIIFTSNIGSDEICASGGEDMSSIIDALGAHFRPEFINRIDEVIPFHPLLFEDVRTILRGMIDDVRKRLADRNMGIRMYQGAYEHLAEVGYKPEFGARELRRAVERNIVTPLGEKIVEGAFAPGDMIDVLMENGKLVYRKGERSSQQAQRA